MRDKLSPEQIEEKRAKRREKRSAFFSRMVDEFKKVMVIYATLFVTGFLVWEHIIYANGITPAFPSAVTVALISGFFGVIVAYCFSAFLEKNSLNKNGLTKTSSGTIAKIVETVSTVAANLTPKSTKENPGDDDVAG
ncbi:MAG TPA: hypothetical protein VN538_12720 [Clostridia bacterium]|nr:hypothetical protein [Clostridia bacterium]